MSEEQAKTVGGCGCMILILILGFIFIPIYRGSAQTFTATVEKTVVDDGDTFFVLLIEGKSETEIFQNEDSYSFWKFDSNDVLMNIETGQTYEFKVAGWRVHFLSMYRNIIEFQPVGAG